MPEIYYGRTEERRIALQEHLIESKFDGDSADWIFNKLKEQIKASKQIILNKKFMHQITQQTVDVDPKEIEKVEIFHDENYVVDGEKAILGCGPSFYDGLETWYKVEKYINGKLNLNDLVARSFEEMIQNYINAILNPLVVENLDKDLDKERKQLKAKPEDKNLPGEGPTTVESSKS